MINARSETLLEKPAFSRLIKQKRCLVVADGYYEWKTNEDGKQPYRIMRNDGRIFSFAGLYDTWKQPDGEPITSCTIITCKPSGFLTEIHDRMPVILSEEDEEIWINSKMEDTTFLKSLLVPFNTEEMKAYRVPQMVGNPRNDVIGCIEALV